MIKSAETTAIIALLQLKAVSWNQLAEQVEEAGSAVAVLDRYLAQQNATLFDDSSSPPDAGREAIIAELEGWEREGMDLVTVLDDGYPVNLRTVHDRPPLLFVRGRLDAADEKSVAVVGTRQVSDDGLRRTAVVAQGLSEAGYVIVSGLAAGVDTAAHTSALAAGGRTVAVIGTGLRRSYPKENADLQRELGKHHAVLSQFWPDQPPGKHTFPMRNAVMSGFAQATVVIEASHTSGARMQARLALQHGRPVFLLRSLLAHAWARDYATRAGTYVVDSVDQIVDELERRYATDLSLLVG
jgi:DNA processing protein